MAGHLEEMVNPNVLSVPNLSKSVEGSVSCAFYHTYLQQTQNDYSQVREICKLFTKEKIPEY